MKNKKIINNKVKYLLEVSYNTFMKFIEINNHNSNKIQILKKFEINKNKLNYWI